MYKIYQKYMYKSYQKYIVNKSHIYDWFIIQVYGMFHLVIHRLLYSSFQGILMECSILYKGHQQYLSMAITDKALLKTSKY